MSDRVKSLLSVAGCLLPTLVGFCLYSQLPAQIPVHFGFNGQADSWWPKFIAVACLPLMLAAMDALVLFVTLHDPKRNNIHGPAMNVLFWLVPVIDNVVMYAIYAIVLGVHVNISVICLFGLGLLFVVLGNALPKVKQNYVFGVRTSWTLDDPENWIHTARFSSRCFIASGLFLMAVCWFSSGMLLIVEMVVIVGALGIAPYIYSYQYYKAHKPASEKKG